VIERKFSRSNSVHLNINKQKAEGEMENLLILLLVGLVAGWLTGKVMRGSGFGVIGDIIIGLLGAVVGSWLFGQLGVFPTGLLGSIVVAFVGAVLLVFVVRLLRRA
jgi:uncharacterized membrane protein YeaQ/YmgE (transglycosylase-associated protein family)